MNQTVNDTVRIDGTKISQADMDSLSRALISAVKRFYSDPKNIAAYHAWLQTEEGKKYAE